MIINGIEYKVTLTDKTPEEIGDKFKKILENNGKPEEIEDLLSQYPSLPDFVCPYLFAIYYKSLSDFKKAARLVDEAITKLKSDSVNSSSKDISDGSIYRFIYEPFEKQLWPQAAEIYANVDRFNDSLEAYKQYQLQHCRIKGDDVSGGLLSFRPISKYALSDLINNQLTVCSPRVMNDPFDTLLLSWGDYYLKNKQGRKHIEPYVKSMDYFRIRSFSKIPKGDVGSRILSNVLMWSHYADNHYGMCIEYHFSDEFTKNDGDRVLRFRNVKYKPKEETVSLDITTINTDLSLLTKMDAWKYEDEVRLISYIPDEEGQFVPIKLDTESRIKNIYFGIRCPSSDIATVQSILKGQNVHFYQMRPSPTDIFNPIIDSID